MTANETVEARNVVSKLTGNSIPILASHRSAKYKVKLKLNPPHDSISAKPDRMTHAHKSTFTHHDTALVTTHI